MEISTAFRAASTVESEAGFRSRDREEFDAVGDGGINVGDAVTTADDGSADGAAVGPDDVGTVVGNGVGAGAGATDGDADGTAVGAPDVGTTVGNGDGGEVGDVGISDGSDVGIRDGAREGSKSGEGAGDGSEIGISDGRAVGDEAWTAVGAAVAIVKSTDENVFATPGPPYPAPALVSPTCPQRSYATPRL